MQDEIIKQIRTAEEKNEAVVLVEEILENIFKRDPEEYPNQSPFLKNLFQAVITEIDKRNIRKDRKQMEAFLLPIIKQIRSLPELKLTVAIEPNEELINNVKIWTSKNLSQNTVINFEVDPDILGGAIIVSPNGKYLNYALNEQLDEFFTQKRQEIMTLL